MAKRTPLPCTPANCGENFDRCGKRSTYTQRKCRCDACFDANFEYLSENREVISAQRKLYRDANQDAIADYNKRYYAEHQEALNERCRQYRSENSEAIAAQRKQYNDANLQQRREKHRQWRLANPDRWRDHRRRMKHRRRALMKAAQVVDFTIEQLDEKMAYYGYSCYLKLPGVCTGAFDEIEHVKPISKLGPHMIANLRPACTPCNGRKSDKWPFEAAA